MLDYLNQNWGSLLVGLILAAVVIAIVRYLIRQRRSGNPCAACSAGCGGNCGHCSGCSPKPGEKAGG